MTRVFYPQEASRRKTVTYTDKYRGRKGEGNIPDTNWKKPQVTREKRPRRKARSHWLEKELRSQVKDFLQDRPGHKRHLPEGSELQVTRIPRFVSSGCKPNL